MARSLKARQAALVAEVRTRGGSWVQVAAAVQRQFGVNRRAALRIAHGWSQGEAADRWNLRWPDDPKTFKNFSYWEQWPASTGYAPSLEVLARLAELYECSVADLVADVADFGAGVPGAHLAGVLEPGGAVAMLEGMDVNDVARVASSWAAQAGSVVAGRSMLLKLSAGLSLAAASAHLLPDGGGTSAAAGAAQEGFSGIWHSRYVYRRPGTVEEIVGEHYVVARQQGSRFVAQGLPHSTGSELRLELNLDPPVATGTWRETTSPTGQYRGATYHGALQMVIDPSRQNLSGMWLGFGRRFTVNAGEWTLTRQETSTSKAVQKAYHERV
ncbi:hypothetical protein L1785_02650 [Antribacter sp. KLBMP9083]|uniref:HTH cro/C1-type domain-containing protein n=1 Tax=Antribacter soli TaxID=2910976 RepID=A0AA41QAH7_9MICO|nr:hypothetical protein [Antribacter soli]MCF4119869.1 hypothetical protein [Antribacter soli]